MSDRNWDEHHKWAALSVNNEDEDDDTRKRDGFTHRAEADEARARQKLHAGTPDVEPSEDLLLGSEAHHHHGAVEVRVALFLCCSLLHVNVASLVLARSC